MLVLGLDTSTPAVQVGVVEVDPDGAWQTRAAWCDVDGRRHGEVLAAGVRAALAEAGASRAGLSAVAVGLGPGPFTGLRVGIVTAAALSDALGVPAYGVCSLDALGEGPRIAVTDARRREVYWAEYDTSGRVDGPHVERPAALAERLAQRAHAPRVVGAGALLHADVLGLEPSALEAGPLYPDGCALAGLVVQRALRVEPGDPLTPLYLRRPDAEEPTATKSVLARR